MRFLIDDVLFFFLIINCSKYQAVTSNYEKLNDIKTDKTIFFLFINDTFSYSFQPNTRSNSWLLLPIDTDGKEKESRNTKRK